MDLLNLKAKVTGQTIANGTKNVEIMVPLKYLSNFWRTLAISLINCWNYSSSKLLWTLVL